ncbi:MAG: DUF4405 domain-containing protein [Parcubacteria group bacterium]|jgi:hypothetical protein
MNKIKIKYAIDFITLVSFVITAITGAIIFLFLPPGEGNRGIHNDFLGWGRHDWGAVHDWAGIIMVVFALIHVAMYWKMFVCMTKNFFKKNEECQISKEVETEKK